MRAVRLSKPSPIEHKPLENVEVKVPVAGPGQLLVKISASAICHTDLHIVEGDIVPPKLPVIPGHQVIGRVISIGPEVSSWAIGDRVGIPWLYRACRTCAYCLRGEENLCPDAEFTGFHRPGGYAETMVAEADYALPIPDFLRDEQAAPLLCGGIIGFRSLHKADLRPGERLGLVGFGSSAHLTIQVALHWGCEVYVFTRSAGHRSLALELGATWAGGVEDDSPALLDRAILFAPSGKLVPIILEKIRPGGTLAINAIHLSPIPEFPYRLIYGERTLRSVANATYQDGIDFLKIAAEIPIRVTTKSYPLASANQALQDLKQSTIDGSGVLQV
ncbi:MAG: zinc-dependent alcohol dehydrogenase family protein [Chloroflexi bacterium]|nr:zinc-dependent alcohol dehydrogenase family protein [Chloroflexota bacterium]